MASVSSSREMADGAARAGALRPLSYARRRRSNRPAATLDRLDRASASVAVTTRGVGRKRPVRGGPRAFPRRAGAGTGGINGARRPPRRRLRARDRSRPLPPGPRGNARRPGCDGTVVAYRCGRVGEDGADDHGSFHAGAQPHLLRDNPRLPRARAHGAERRSDSGLSGCSWR
jgi:hypothetical protein